MKQALILSLLALAPTLVAGRPRAGREASTPKVDISDYIALQQNANPCITPAELDAAFDPVFTRLC